MADRATQAYHVRVNGLGAGLITLIPALVGYKVSIIAAMLSANVATQITIQDTLGVVLAVFYMPANVPIPMPEVSVGWGVSPADTGININVTAASLLQGVVAYRYIPNAAEY